MPCSGQHNCCRVKGKDCQHLLRDHGTRKFACGLYVKHGNWDDVLADPEYPTGAWAEGLNCRDWPDGAGVNGDYCSKCGTNPHLKKGSYV